jgi:transketolase
MTVEEAVSLRKLGSVAQGHPDKLSLDWLDTSTGSLGQGFSNALGMAIAYKYQKCNAKVVALLGDGELQEGQVWETAMCAAHYKLGNFTAIIDYNKLQSDDLNENIMGLAPLQEKFTAFGWQVIEIDGHNFDEINDAFDQVTQEKLKPSMIIAHTIKGKGVDYMEKVPAWHGSVRMTRENTLSALTQLGLSANEAEYWLATVVKRLD